MLKFLSALMAIVSCYAFSQTQIGGDTPPQFHSEDIEGSTPRLPSRRLIVGKINERWKLCTGKERAPFTDIQEMVEEILVRDSVAKILAAHKIRLNAPSGCGEECLSQEHKNEIKCLFASKLKDEFKYILKHYQKLETQKKGKGQSYISSLGIKESESKNFVDLMQAVVKELDE